MSEEASLLPRHYKTTASLASLTLLGVVSYAAYQFVYKPKKQLASSGQIDQQSSGKQGRVNGVGISNGAL